MRRARVRAARRRLAANPYTRRVKWYAPWRVWGRGGGIRASFRRARIRRGHLAVRRPRIRLRARAASRWGGWRARRLRYAGLGIAGRTPLRLHARHWFSRGTWRGVRRRLSLRRWLRNRPPPKPLLGGRHRLSARTAALHRFGRTPLGRWVIRRDRRRRERWMSRQRRLPAVPVPGRPVPADAKTALNELLAAGFTLKGSPSRTGSSVGGSMDARAMADQIESHPVGNISDLADAHVLLRGVHTWLGRFSEELDRAGTHPAYAEAAREAAGHAGASARYLGSVGLGQPGARAAALGRRLAGHYAGATRDPQAMHENLTDAHVVQRAVATWLGYWADAAARSGSTPPAYIQVAYDLAGQSAASADSLHQMTAGGVMRGPGN